MKLSNLRQEVMQTIEKSMDELLNTYLRPVEENWQPAELLPDTSEPGFFEKVTEMHA